MISLDGLIWPQEPICLDESTWPPELIHLDRSTWLPKQTSLDRLSKLSEPRSLDGLTWLPEPTCLDRLLGRWSRCLESTWVLEPVQVDLAARVTSLDWPSVPTSLDVLTWPPELYV